MFASFRVIARPQNKTKRDKKIIACRVVISRVSVNAPQFPPKKSGSALDTEILYRCTRMDNFNKWHGPTKNKIYGDKCFIQTHIQCEGTSNEVDSKTLPLVTDLCYCQ